MMLLRKYKYAWLVVALFILSALYTCTPKAEKTELIVSAAANFTDVMKECAALYEAEYPDTKIVLNFASTGILAQQIVAGAPVDIFFSASEKHSNLVIEKGVVAVASQKNMPSNSIVIAHKKGASTHISSPEDLTQPAIKKIAVGNIDTSGSGIAAKEALTFYSIYENIQQKTVNGESVRQVLDYIKKGEVDAGIIFYTDYLVAEKELDLDYTFPKQSHKPIKNTIFLLKNTGAKDAAQRFIDFLASERGARVFRQYGYIAP